MPNILMQTYPIGFTIQFDENQHETLMLNESNSNTYIILMTNANLITAQFGKQPHMNTNRAMII